MKTETKVVSVGSFPEDEDLDYKRIPVELKKDEEAEKLKYLRQLWESLFFGAAIGFLIPLFVMAFFWGKP